MTENSKQGNVRLGGLVKLLLGSLGLGAVFCLTMLVFPRFDYDSDPVEVIGLALPGAFALVGLLELVTGIAFGEWARRWDELKGWQRGVLGTVIVVVAGFAIVVAFALVASSRL